MGERVLFGQTAGRDRLQPREESLIAGVLALDCREGVFVQPVIVAIVTLGRRALRMSLEFGLIIFLKQRGLGGDPRLDGRRSGAEAGSGFDRAAADSEEKSEGVVAHPVKVAQTGKEQFGAGKLAVSPRGRQ
jgi:hypothetical protein